MIVEGRKGDRLPPEDLKERDPKIVSNDLLLRDTESSQTRRHLIPRGLEQRRVVDKTSKRMNS